jgi:ABC-type microcin C transport system duplicated ATPase subunit YejF
MSLRVHRGETLGLVGESGCGKSTLGRAILQLVRPTAGEIRFDSIELTKLSDAELRPLRRRMEMVFQDPFGSLNPRMTAGATVAEPMLVHRLATGSESRDKVPSCSAPSASTRICSIVSRMSCISWNLI